MSDLYWLTDEQLAKMKPYFPKPRGKPRADDKKVMSGIIYIIRNGLRWRDAAKEYGPYKTLYNRWERWTKKGIFARMLRALADQDGDTDTLMIDATHLKAHRTASSLRLKERDGGRKIGRTKGGMNSKLHVVTNARGRPLRMVLTAGQTSDYTGARELLDDLPKARHMIADRGYDADWFREALENKNITPCIPLRRCRRIVIPHDAKRYKIENSFGLLKDWRRVATRYDRCPDMFFSACTLAAVVIFWL